jgi:hypothetical protein
VYQQSGSAPFFDIAIHPSGYFSRMSTSLSGYTAVSRVGGSAEFGISLSMSWKPLSQIAFVLLFQLTNQDSYPQTADIGIRSDIHLNNDYAPVAAIGSVGSSSRGFTISSAVSSPTYRLTFVCRNYPLVTDVSTYWFGYYANRSANQWEQVTTPSISGIDSGMAFSWQGVSVPSYGSATRSVIVKLGSDEVHQISLTLNFPVVTSQLYDAGSLLISGRATSSSTHETFSLCFVIDHDFSNIFQYSEYYSAGSDFSFSFSASDWSSNTSLSEVSFYAVNLYGDVSSGQTLSLGGNVAMPSMSASTRSLTGMAVGVMVGGSAVICIAVLVAGLLCRRRKALKVEGE